MSISDRLDEITARADAATEGPWEWEATTPSMAGAKWSLRIAGKPGIRLAVSEYQHGPDNAEFIAHARADVPWLVEQVRKRDTALQAVLDLHKAHAEQVLAADCSAETCDCEDGCQTVPIKVCGHCMDLGVSAHAYAYEAGGIETVTWPCGTYRAIATALGEGTP